MDDIRERVDQGIVAAFSEVWKMYCRQDVDVEVVYGDGPYAAYAAWDNEKGCYRVGVKGRFPHDTRAMVRTLFHELGHTVKDAWDSFVETTAEEIGAAMAGDQDAVARCKKASHKIPTVENDVTAWAEERCNEWYEYIMMHATDEPEPLREMVARNWDEFATVRQLAERSLKRVAPEKAAALERQERRRQAALERARGLVDALDEMG